MNQPQLGTYDYIAISAIHPSTTNPRKHFDEAALEELALSIREVGVTVPILVRPLARYQVSDRGTFIRYGIRKSHRTVPIGDNAWPAGADPRFKTFSEGTEEENHAAAQAWVDAQNESFGAATFEIVSGERRYRAAQIAGLDEIPAFFRNLDDEEAQDLQMVENLQREDLHPVEEAEGYQALMAGGATAQDVAKKAGKTLTYVVQRLKLLALGIEAKELFADGHLTLGHALLLARLTPKDQIAALVFLLGIAQWEIKRDNPAEKLIAERARRFSSRSVNRGRLVDPTEAQLHEWIKSHVLLQLKGVPWDLGDAGLLPNAGACTTCPKRTGANAALFLDLTTVEDVCSDSVCFGEKQKAFVQLTQRIAIDAGTPLLKISAKASSEKLEQKPVELKAGKAVVVAKKAIREGQWVEAKKNECPATVQGLFVDGDRQGKLKYVCADQACKVHKHHIERPRSSGNVASPRMSEKDTQAKEKEYLVIETKVRKEIAEQILEDANPGMDEVRTAVFHQISNYAYICRRMEWPFHEKANESTWEQNSKAQPVVEENILKADIYVLGHLVLLDAIAGAAQPTAWRWNQKADDRKHLWRIAKNYGVDADAIAAEVETELQAPPTLKEAVVPVAAKKVAAKKTGRGPKLSAAGRKKIADAMKKRWAKNGTPKTKSSTKPGIVNKIAAVARHKSGTAIDGKSAGAGELAEQEVG